MPKWGRVRDATPGSRVSALATDAAAAAPEIDLPGADETVSFERHITPLFRERDRASMKFAFERWSYEDVKRGAVAILERLRNGSMPCDGAWPHDWIGVFERWSQSGTAT
jgi:hypothetical protein